VSHPIQVARPALAPRYTPVNASAVVCRGSDPVSARTTARVIALQHVFTL